MICIGSDVFCCWSDLTPSEATFCIELDMGCCDWLDCNGVGDEGLTSTELLSCNLLFIVVLDICCCWFEAGRMWPTIGFNTLSASSCLWDCVDDIVSLWTNEISSFIIFCCVASFGCCSLIFICTGGMISSETTFKLDFSSKIGTGFDVSIDDGAFVDDSPPLVRCVCSLVFV